MTCYFRHMRHVFERAGIEVTKENKKAIDQRIHELVGVKYKDCPATWSAVKSKLAENEIGFIKALKDTASQFD
ncbi:hypothetical protein EU522_00600 [Candidatus Thorarchaeota archaeon]|nr:MAG: hypothetical protein EU522_00600 [Candidatus Thorarchaeota archaeon]